MAGKSPEGGSIHPDVHGRHPGPKSFEPMEDFDDYSNVTDYMEDQGLLSQIQDGIEDQEENLLLNLYINDKFSSMAGSGQSDGDRVIRF